MELFEVDTCVTYWVAAEKPEDCRSLIEFVEGFDLVEEYGYEPDVTEYDMAKATAHLIWDDKDGEQRSLLSFFEEATEPAVLACSEW
jgi:hypothetical protein